MKNCPKCNASVIDTAKFCNKCGYNFQANENLFCTECGARLQPDSAFCVECGTAVQGGGAGFDFSGISSLENEANAQLNSKIEAEKFYNNATLDGTKLMKYTGNDDTVYIPDGITSIEPQAFDTRQKFKKIRLPASCSNIQGIALPDYVEQIEVDSGSVYFKVIDGVLFTYDGRELIKATSSIRGFYSIPSTVENIHVGAFECNNGITEVDIPSSVRCISAFAFLGCTGLKTARISGNWLEIGYESFFACESLTTLELNNGVRKICENAFEGCSSLSSVVIPSTVNLIEYAAFSQCRELKTVRIFGGDLEIGRYAFMRCPNIREIELKNGVRVLREGVFSDCNYLETVEIPRTLETIENYVFGTEHGLKTLKLPRGIDVDVYKFGGNCNTKIVYID